MQKVEEIITEEKNNYLEDFSIDSLIQIIDFLDQDVITSCWISDLANQFNNYLDCDAFFVEYYTECTKIYI